MKEYQELLNMCDIELLSEYKNTHTGVLQGERDSISLILNYRFSKRMIRLTWAIGILAVLQLITVGFQIYLMYQK